MDDQPRAHPAPDGRPPLADGHTIPQPDPHQDDQPLTARQYLAALLLVALVVAAVVAVGVG